MEPAQQSSDDFKFWSTSCCLLSQACTCRHRKLSILEKFYRTELSCGLGLKIISEKYTFNEFNFVSLRTDPDTLKS